MIFAMTETSPDLLLAPLHLDAVLTPNRSLGPRGFAVLMAVLIVVNFAAGIVFWLKGAWPVFGFCGLDVALVYLAFKANYRSARAHETVQLSDDELRVRKVDQHGHVRAWAFQPYWVRVSLEENPDESTALFLVSHGRALKVASCLGPDERADFANTLKAALMDMRTRPYEVPAG